MLNAFAEELDNDIALAALDGDSAVLVAQSSTARSRVSMGFTVGSRLPVLHTALGTALLSHAPHSICRDLLAPPISRPTDTAEDDPQALLARIDRAEMAEYAVVAGEFERGIKGFAVPVGERGGMPYAIGVTTPSDAADRATTRQTLQLCAAKLANIQALTR